MVPNNMDELQNLSESEKFSFHDLIQHQWFGSNFFQVFINQKADNSDPDESGIDKGSKDLVSPDAEKPYIVEIQINKNKFDGQEVKLILVRSIDFLIDHQAESVKIKRDRML